MVEEATRRYSQARQELLARPGAPDVGRRRALVALTDDWLAGLFDSAGGGRAGCSLIAVGGYGRGELSPGSDLDLVLLHPTGAGVSSLADQIWYPIWDAGLKLDHSVRSPVEARRVAGQDLRVVLGILDARVISGDQELAAGLRSSVLADWRALAASRLEELSEYVTSRRERFGELAHLAEPDLKESYGGLRELTILRALEASWLVNVDTDSLTESRQMLLDVRDALHLVTGRAHDRLLMQEQDAVSAMLGQSSGADASDASESDPHSSGRDALLRRVSAAGRQIAYTSDLAWYRTHRLVKRKRTTPFKKLRGTRDRTPLTEGVVVQEGEAVLAESARPDRDPVLVLRAAAAAAQANLRLSPHAVGRLASESAPMPVPWPADARDALVSLLGAGRSMVPVWEALDQAGVISRLLPGWDVLRSAPQHNPVHRFTVDRHLVEAAVRASDLTRQVSRPDLLLVGALVHDYGKGRPGDHTDNGVVLVQGLAPHLGFDAHDSEILVRLVALHLLLPDTATRRDLEDPATLSMVAEAVGDVEVLDLLHALTIADAAATGPAAWSDWKASLISELVSRTRSALQGRPPAPQRLTETQRAMAGGEGIDVLVESARPAVLVTVAAPDALGLLATVAGVLAMHRLAVRQAQTETLSGRAITVWSVLPEFGEPPSQDLLRDDIRRALEGRLDIAERLRKREEAYARGNRESVRRAGWPPATAEHICGASDSATVLEIRAHDRPGLLYRVARIISGTEANIVGAKVATLGSDVVDVFYLVDDLGVPLSEEAIERVRSQVLDALADAETNLS